MMKTALQQNNDKKGSNLQGLPCVAPVSSIMWHKSYNNQFNDTSIEGSGGRS
jgi:hypothetical protein